MIRCKNFKSWNSGCLVGFADIDLKTEYGYVTIKGCMLFQKNGKRWIKMPGQEYEKNGEKKYPSFLAFENNEEWEKFSNDVKKAIENYSESRSVFNE